MVSERGTLGFTTPPSNEQPELEGAPGDWLVHYTYDALGRLIRKQTPVRAASDGEQLAVRTERYFYDGARRIQEVVTDPIVIGDPGGPGGGEIPIEAEMLEPGSGGTGGGSGSGGGGGVLANGPYVDREYVYVPSGASGYVDEFICQIDRYQDLWYILQDVNFNVIAMTDAAGEVVRQHTFDPYGEILAAEDFDTHPGIKVGHQGLFFDRLEPPAPAGGLISMSAAVQLQPGVFGLYQARNRVLLPRYGRWAQKDPNASGMLHASLWHSGVSPIPSFAAGSLSGTLTDGSNLFAFIGNSPYDATDPAGLFGFVSGLMTGFNLFDTMTDVLDQARQGITLADEYVSTYSEYAIEQDLMFDYILDWSTANDEALEYAASRTLVSAGSDPLMMMAGAVPRRGAGMKTEGIPRKQLAKAKMRGEFSFSIDGVMFKSPEKSFDQLMRRHMPGSRNADAKTRNDPVPGSIKTPSELKQACKDICDKIGRNQAFREKMRGKQSGRFEEYVEYGGAVFQVKGEWSRPTGIITHYTPWSQPPRNTLIR